MKTTKLLTILALTVSFMACQAKVRGAIGGSGTANHIPKFIDPSTIGNSAVYENGGLVGIGTTSPGKTYRLTVDGAGSFYGIHVKNTGDVGIESIGSNYGLRGTGNSRGVSGISSKGFGVYGKTTSGFAGYFEGGRNYFEGNVAVGTTSPATNAKLHAVISLQDYSAKAIFGKSRFGFGVYGKADTGQGVVGVSGKGKDPDERHIGYNIGVYGDGGRYGGYFVAEEPQGQGIYAKGGPQGYAAHFRGNVIIKNYAGTATVMELGEGLDYAEGFDVSKNKEISPGTVLIIDPDNAGKLALSDKPYDSKVAGIVAGAKGQGSGVRLGAGQFDYDVALAGRVYCNVDATEIAVQPGDLLTTSATEGYAMKAADYIRAQGAILGKAMEKLEKGRKGQILVLVTLQ